MYTTPGEDTTTEQELHSTHRAALTNDILQSLLVNNTTPPDNMLLEAKIAISEPVRRLENYVKEIEDLQRKISELEGKRMHLEQEIEPYRIILSPARRLPTDIIREIFIHCLPVTTFPTMTGSDAPLLLTRICSDWRHIALSTPALWCRLHFPWMDTVDRTQPGEWDSDEEDDQISPLFIPNKKLAGYHTLMKRRCEGMVEWLSRSGELPLALSLILTQQTSGLPTTPEKRITEIVISILLEYSSRLQELHFDAPSEVFHEIDHTLGNLPNLRVLSMRRAIEILGGGNTSVQMMQSPNLQRLGIVNLSWPRIKSSILSTLTDINISCDDLSSADAVTLLSALPLLIHCKLNIQDRVEHSTLTPTCIKLASLHTLVICYGTLRNVGQSNTQLVECLEVPNLRWFSYSVESSGLYGTSEDENLVPSSPALILVQNGQLELRKLSLTPYGFKLSDVNATFDLAPTIVYLQFLPPFATYSEATDFKMLQYLPTYDLSALIVSEDNDNKALLLPNLLVFEAHFAENVDDETVFKFILSRLNPDSKRGVAVLESVRIAFHRDMQVDIKPRIMQHAKKRGISFDLQLFYEPIAPKTRNPSSIFYESMRRTYDKDKAVLYPYDPMFPDTLA